MVRTKNPIFVRFISCATPVNHRQKVTHENVSCGRPVSDQRVATPVLKSEDFLCQMFFGLSRRFNLGTTVAGSGQLAANPKKDTADLGGTVKQVMPTGSVMKTLSGISLRV